MPENVLRKTLAVRTRVSEITTRINLYFPSFLERLGLMFCPMTAQDALAPRTFAMVS